MFDNSLSGTLPSSWGKGMPHMRSITLSKNMFSGSVPLSWGKWKELEGFYTWGNEELVGCLPARWQQQLAYLEFEDEVFYGTAIDGFCQRKADSPAAKLESSEW